MLVKTLHTCSAYIGRGRSRTAKTCGLSLDLDLDTGELSCEVHGIVKKKTCSAGLDHVYAIKSPIERKTYEI